MDKIVFLAVLSFFVLFCVAFYYFSRQEQKRTSAMLDHFVSNPDKIAEIYRSGPDGDGYERLYVRSISGIIHHVADHFDSDRAEARLRTAKAVHRARYGLVEEEVEYVQSRVARPINSLPEFETRAQMVAARPAWLDMVSSTDLCDLLVEEGFVLNPNAPGQWLWQRLVPQTSCQHVLCFLSMGGPAIKAYSFDVIANRFEDAGGDVPLAADPVTQVKRLLESFAENVSRWHADGFTQENFV